MKINYHEKEIDVELIGGFEFNHKEYIVCSYDDDEVQKLVLFESYHDQNGLHTKDIPKEEIPSVLEHFNLLKEKLMEEDDGE